MDISQCDLTKIFPFSKDEFEDIVRNEVKNNNNSVLRKCVIDNILSTYERYVSEYKVSKRMNVYIPYSCSVNDQSLYNQSFNFLNITYDLSSNREASGDRIYPILILNSILKDISSLECVTPKVFISGFNNNDIFDSSINYPFHYNFCNEYFDYKNFLFSKNYRDFVKLVNKNIATKSFTNEQYNITGLVDYTDGSTNSLICNASCEEMMDYGIFFFHNNASIRNYFSDAHKHNVSVFYVVLYFSPDIFIQKSGYIKDTKIFFSYSKDEKFIEFHVENSLTTVRYNLKDYLKILKTLNYTYREANIGMSLFNIYPGFLILRYDVHVYSPKSNFVYYWHNDYKKKLLVTYQLYDNDNYKRMTCCDILNIFYRPESEYVLKNLIVDRDLVNKGLEYAYRVSADKFKPVEVFSYLQSHNRRWFVGGKDILSRESLNDADDLYVLAHVIYLMVYVNKYKMGRSLQHNIEDINTDRGFVSPIQTKHNKNKNIFSYMFDFLIFIFKLFFFYYFIIVNIINYIDSNCKDSKKKKKKNINSIENLRVKVLDLTVSNYYHDICSTFDKKKNKTKLEPDLDYDAAFTPNRILKSIINLDVDDYKFKDTYKFIYSDIPYVVEDKQSTYILKINDDDNIATKFNIDNNIDQFLNKFVSLDKGGGGRCLYKALDLDISALPSWPRLQIISVLAHIIKKNIVTYDETNKRRLFTKYDNYPDVVYLLLNKKHITQIKFISDSNTSNVVVNHTKSLIQRYSDKYRQSKLPSILKDNHSQDVISLSGISDNQETPINNMNSNSGNNIINRMRLSLNNSLKKKTNFNLADTFKKYKYKQQKPLKKFKNNIINKMCFQNETFTHASTFSVTNPLINDRFISDDDDSLIDITEMREVINIGHDSDDECILKTTSLDSNNCEIGSINSAISMIDKPIGPFSSKQALEMDNLGPSNVNNLLPSTSGVQSTSVASNYIEMELLHTVSGNTTTPNSVDIEIVDECPSGCCRISDIGSFDIVKEYNINGKKAMDCKLLENHPFFDIDYNNSTNLEKDKNYIVFQDYNTFTIISDLNSITKYFIPLISIERKFLYIDLKTIDKVQQYYKEFEKENFSIIDFNKFPLREDDLKLLNERVPSADYYLGMRHYTVYSKLFEDSDHIATLEEYQFNVMDQINTIIYDFCEINPEYLNEIIKKMDCNSELVIITDFYNFKRKMHMIDISHFHEIYSFHKHIKKSLMGTFCIYLSGKSTYKRNYINYIKLLTEFDNFADFFRPEPVIGVCTLLNYEEKFENILLTVKSKSRTQSLEGYNHSFINQNSLILSRKNFNNIVEFYNKNLVVTWSISKDIIYFTPGESIKKINKDFDIQFYLQNIITIYNMLAESNISLTSGKFYCHLDNSYHTFDISNSSVLPIAYISYPIPNTLTFIVDHGGENIQLDWHNNQGVYRLRIPEKTFSQSYENSYYAMSVFMKNHPKLLRSDVNIIFNTSYMNINDFLHTFDNIFEMYYIIYELDYSNAVNEIYTPNFEHSITSYSTVVSNMVTEIRSTWQVSVKIAIDNIKKIYEDFIYNYEKYGNNNMEVTNNHFGVFCGLTGKWIHKPDIISDKGYMAYYDGESIKFFNKNRSSALSTAYGFKGFSHHARYCAVTSDFVLMNGKDLYDNTASFNIENFKLPVINVLSGCPGSGKTTYIKKNVQADDIVLTTTKSGACELRDQMIAAGIKFKFVKTGDSYLINSRHNCNTIWIDEGFMKHPGEILLYAYYSNCKIMNILGDCAQIPYINRFKQILHYHKFNMIPSFGVYRHITYRCPQDVAILINKLKAYPFLVESKNDVNASLKIVKMNIISEVPKVDAADVHYLTYTQSEKFTLINNGVKPNKVNTVHEYQGLECKHIILVRLVNKPNEIYNSKQHILVALTRHTVSFTYYTIIMDKTTELIEEIISPRVGGEVCTISTDLAYNDLPRVPNVVHKNLAKDIIFSNFNNDTPNLIPCSYNSYDYELDDITPIAPYNSLGLPYLQDVIDTRFPGRSIHDRAYDIINFDTSDTIINSYGFNISMTTHKVALPNIYARPLLRTGLQPPLTDNLKTIAMSYADRNGSVPDYTEPTHQDMFLDKVYDRFVKTYIVDRDAYDSFKYSTIYPETNVFSEWINTKPKNIINILQKSNKLLSDEELHVFDFTIKKNVKPDLSDSSSLNINTPQTVSAHSKLINAIFCPIVKVMKERLISTMDNCFMINNDMSIKDFEKKFSAMLPPKYFKNYKHITEVDFAKYDKSQTHNIYLLEEKILIALGMPKELIPLWRYANCHSRLINFKNKFRGSVNWQRKSGTAFTYFGNTILCMAMLAYSMNLKDVIVLFSGDDSLILSKSKINLLNATDEFAALFNMEAKLLRYNSLYFCSKFIVPVSDELWKIVTDPFKLLLKLGRYDLVDKEHAECFRVSCTDIVSDYNNLSYVPIFEDFLHDRYKYQGDIASLLSTIYNTIMDYDEFHAMFDYSNCTDKFTTKPSLDI